MVLGKPLATRILLSQYNGAPFFQSKFPRYARGIRQGPCVLIKSLDAEKSPHEKITGPPWRVCRERVQEGINLPALLVPTRLHQLYSGDALRWLGINNAIRRLSPGG